MTETELAQAYGLTRDAVKATQDPRNSLDSEKFAYQLGWAERGLAILDLIDPHKQAISGHEPRQHDEGVGCSCGKDWPHS